MKVSKITSLCAVALITVGAAAPAFAAGENVSQTSNGVVKFIKSVDPTKPVDPENPETPVDPVDPTDPTGPKPGTAGPLSIDYTPGLNFGVQSIKTSNTEEKYLATAQTFKPSAPAGATQRSTYVQVTDGRGETGGWALTVKRTDFKVDGTGASLNGAKILWHNGNTNSEKKVADATKDITSTPELEIGTADAPVMSAPINGNGQGTWVYRAGVDSGENANKYNKVSDADKAERTVTDKVELTIPAFTNKLNAEYKSTLTWTLKDVPDPAAKGNL